MFPTGFPGIGLVLLRVCVGFAMLDLATGWEDPQRWGAAEIIAALLGSLLLVGALTPVSAGLVGVWAAWVMVDGNHAAVNAVVLLNAVALALIGPGAYSIDARLFARRVLVSGSSRADRGRLPPRE
jgi:hypothetical protein